MHHWIGHTVWYPRLLTQDLGTYSPPPPLKIRPGVALSLLVTSDGRHWIPVQICSPSPSLVLTSNGGHQKTYGCQADVRHPTGMLSCSCLALVNHTFLLRRFSFFLSFSLADPGGSNFFNFHTLFGKILPNNRFCPNSRVGSPYLGNPGSATASVILTFVIKSGGYDQLCYDSIFIDKNRY